MAEGYSSWFSDETCGMLGSVRVEDSTAHVDFDAGLPEAIPGASSSAGSTMLLAALGQIVTQFSSVEEAIYSLDGDVDGLLRVAAARCARGLTSAAVLHDRDLGPSRQPRKPMTPGSCPSDPVVRCPRITQT